MLAGALPVAIGGQVQAQQVLAVGCLVAEGRGLDLALDAVPLFLAELVLIQ
jgi:hypothetical protein